MRLTALALALAAPALITAPVAAQVAIEAPPGAARLSLSVTERIEADPDLAIVTGGVTTTAPTATEALRQNSEQMQRVIAAVRRAGIAERDVQTVGVNLNAQYNYEGRRDGQPPRFIGYQASNSVQLRVKDIAKLGAILDSLVESGANQINGPTFTLENPDELLAQARLKTVAKAQASADGYARTAGFRTARLIGIDEAGSNYGGDQIIVTGARTMDVAQSAPPPPVSPGQVRQSVSVNFTYLLER